MKLKWPILFLFCIASAHAQMYRWVDANGRVTYSDTPPPPSAVKQQKKPIPSDEQESSGMPYALSEAAKNFPVTLYTSTGCAPCDEGRALLKKRGIPFSEKTVSSSEDIERMKRAGGNGRLPFLTVGRNSQTGFEAGAWDATLTSAGYPETSQLPSNYSFSSPEPAAPPPPPVETPQAAPPPAAPNPPAQGTTIPGFRF
jgi:glutaredoxin